MEIARGIAEQLARPHGTAGRVIGSVMDIVNRKPMLLAVDMLAPHPGERVLDAGCGTGAAAAELLRRAPCQVTGIDPSHAMIRRAESRLKGKAELVRGRIEEMPFAQPGFDAVLALNVLYFCDPRGAMLERLACALKPGGRIVAYVTHSDTMRNWPFVRAGIHRLFDRAQLARLFSDAGFAPRSIVVQELAVTRSVKGLFAYAER